MNTAWQKVNVQESVEIIGLIKMIMANCHIALRQAKSQEMLAWVINAVFALGLVLFEVLYTGVPTRYACYYSFNVFAPALPGSLPRLLQPSGATWTHTIPHVSLSSTPLSVLGYREGQEGPQTPGD